MNNLSKLIGMFVNRGDKVRDALMFLMKIDSIPDELDLLELDSLTFRVNSLDGLHVARRWLRDKLGSWCDEVGTIWYSCGRMHAEYKDKRYDIHIWLTTKPEDFPLQTDKCRVEKVMYPAIESYEFVCKNG